MEEHILVVDGQDVALTPTEFSLLRILLERQGAWSAPDVTRA